jgi:hypothetical protein
MKNLSGRVLLGKRVLAVLAALVAAGVGDAQTVSLNNGNSLAKVNLFGPGPAGMTSWTINNQPELQQQWFWYRVDGDATGQHSLDTIGAPHINSQNANSVDALYTSGSTFSIDLSYTLNGGQPGGNDWNSDITENIAINNLTGSALTFHFFQYSDFSLAGTLGGETATIFQNNGFYSQANVIKAANQLSETIDIPLANHAEADLATATRDRLNQGSPYTLNDNLASGPNPSLDATWAFEWDLTIDPNSSVTVIKDKKLSVAPVPEPGTAALFGVGLLVFALRRVHRSS